MSDPSGFLADFETRRWEDDYTPEYPTISETIEAIGIIGYTAFAVADLVLAANPGPLESKLGTASNVADDIITRGNKVLKNFDINRAYVKPKHLSTTQGKGQQFLGSTKIEAEMLLKDSIKNGIVKSISDNGLTKAGNASYEIIIDAGKQIGTKGETLVKIILSEDGGMLSAFPIKS